MKLHFIGADHEVTGSAHFLSACGKNILVDYGMEQGVNVFENAELPVSPSEIDYLLVTHAHVDHTGMIPVSFVILCLEILLIFGSLKLNGRIERIKEQVRSILNLLILWKM